MTQHYRFIVSSAQEAVEILRDRLGPRARVLSVRQVQGEGLARFFSAPKLEVVATTDSEPQQPEAETLPEPPPEKTVEQQPIASSQLARILEKGGLTEIVQARLRSEPEWEELSMLPLRSALHRITLLLRGYGAAQTRAELGASVAFVGTAGTGKTTALCKQLATEVFLKQRHAVVLKLDMERANPSDGLAVFCEALGVPLVRSAEAIPAIDADQRLFVDCPGFASTDASETSLLADLLEQLNIESRVLVLNAAYELSLLKDAIAAAAPLKISHLAFTHADELKHWGKLWEFLFDQHRPAIFISTGPNIAGDIVTETFEALVEHSFPMVGKKNALLQTL